MREVLEHKLEVIADFLPSPGELAYRDEAGAVQAVPRPAFRRLARDGDVTAATPVFVTTAETLGTLRADGLERPAGEAWHGRVFRLAEPA